MLLHELNSPPTAWPLDVKINIIYLNAYLKHQNIPGSNHLYNPVFCLHQSDLLN